jgi:hypothetical protein
MRRILVLALFAPLAACATVTRGTTQAFTVDSDPSGAQVALSNGMHCPATPCTFARIPRNSEFVVTVSKEGYRTTSHNVTHQISSGGAAGMAGNVLVGGLIGAAIDGTSGAMNDLVPNPLRVTLEREETPAPPPAAELPPAAAETAPAVETPAAGAPIN